MSGLSEADRHLLEQIRSGDADGWQQLVARYQGRLTAFARHKLRQSSDAEDVVQETFIGFLKGLESFRGQASIETYLFTILRRRIINWTRGRKSTLCLLQDVYGANEDASNGAPADAQAQIPASDPTASWYVRRDEAHALQENALLAGLGELIDGFKKATNFRDLKVIELLFYCQLRNKDAAQVVGLDEKHVALIKHRCLKQVKQRVQEQMRHGPGGSAWASSPGDELDAALDDGMVAAMWQDQRLSCLKRSTVGAYQLGSLDDDWADYVRFHLDVLGCAFCRANHDDLQRQAERDASQAFRDRIMQSTVGFLSRS